MGKLVTAQGAAILQEIHFLIFIVSALISAENKKKYLIYFLVILCVFAPYFIISASEFFKKWHVSVKF